MDRTAVAKVSPAGRACQGQVVQRRGEKGEGAVAQSRTVERWHLGPGVMMHEVNVGRLRGYIFEPPAKHGTHVPAVLDLFGVVGGCQTFRAALLASHGFLTFALAYLNYKDLPKSFPRGIDLSYFEEGARCAARRQKQRG